MSVRQLSYAQAVNEALAVCLERDATVYVMGLGAPDPKGIFGTTLGLQQRFGAKRVLDMPCSENAMTGVAIGSALAGLRPVMTHQRLDFALLAVEQLVNQAAKWHYMFGAKLSVPLVVRLLVGRGWGQGPQHSQSLQAWFAHIPGLKVVMPATPYDAKGLLIASVEDGNPVIFIEHRWLHGIRGPVPEGHYRVAIGPARLAREGADVTLICTSYMVLEGMRAAEQLAADGLSAEVLDLRTLRPFDKASVLRSVRKTGRLLVAEPGWATGGFGAEVVACAAEEAMASLRSPPQRLAQPDHPTPTSPGLARQHYPRAADLRAAVHAMLGRPPPAAAGELPHALHDVPDPTFRGPF